MSLRQFFKRRLPGARGDGATALRDAAPPSHPLNIPGQLDDLRTIEDGWLDGDGTAPRGRLLDWLSESLGVHYPDDAALPHLYPTVEGGVQAEWTLGSHEISLRFRPDDRIGEWHDLALDTDEEDSRELNLSEVSDWEWLAARLSTLSRTA